MKHMMRVALLFVVIASPAMAQQGGLWNDDLTVALAKHYLAIVDGRIVPDDRGATFPYPQINESHKACGLLKRVDVAQRLFELRSEELWGGDVLVRAGRNRAKMEKRYRILAIKAVRDLFDIMKNPNDLPNGRIGVACFREGEWGLEWDLVLPNPIEMYRKIISLYVRGNLTSQEVGFTYEDIRAETLSQVRSRITPEIKKWLRLDSGSDSRGLAAHEVNRFLSAGFTPEELGLSAEDVAFARRYW